MKLYTEVTETNGANIPIRWCINKEEFEYLKHNEIKDPYLLIVVVPERGRSLVQRYLVPIGRLMEYIQLRGIPVKIASWLLLFGVILGLIEGMRAMGDCGKDIWEEAIVVIIALAFLITMALLINLT
ncbi:MAG: hypothetical protein QMD50_00165 [Patescibacteria group bacterium]|nr:hypothetical protein [Patescibacteria group bacterium]